VHRSFTAQSSNVCAGRLRQHGALCEILQVHIRRQGHSRRMHLEDGGVILQRSRRVDMNNLIKSTWPQESGINDIDPIGCGDHKDSCNAIDSVHLIEERCQKSLLHSSAPVSVHASRGHQGIDFIEEHHRRRCPPGQTEYLPNSTLCVSNVGRHYLRWRGCDEGRFRRSGNSSDQRGLAAARRTME